MKACFVSMVLSLAALSGPLQAQEKPAPQPSPEKVRQQAVEAQKELARQFADFQKNLQILKNRLERSSNEQDKRRADQLQQVLDKVDSDDIRNKFVKLQKLLGQKDFDLDEYREAAKQTDDLAKDLSKLVEMFERGDNQLSLDIKEAKDLREALDRLIKEQKIVQKLTQDEQTKKKELADLQNNVKNAAEIAKTIADPNSEKKSPKTPQGAEAKDLKSEAKEGKGDNKSESRDTGKKNQAAEAKDSGPKDAKDPKKAQEERPAESKSKNAEKLPEMKLGLPKPGEKKDQGKGENKEANSKEAKGPKDGQSQSKEAKGNESKQATPKEAGNKDGKPQSPKEAGEAKNNEKGNEKQQPKTGDNKAAPKAKGTENKEASAKTGKGPMDSQSQAKEAKGNENKQATPKEAGKDGKQPEAKEAGEAKNNEKGNEKKEQPKNADAKSKDKGPEAKDASAKESKGSPDSKADTKDAGKESKQAEAKSGETKPGQKSNAKGEPKEGGDAPPPSAKGDKSPMPPQTGEEKDPPGGPKKVQDIDYAIKKMQEAKKKIEEENNKGASDNQAEAIEALEKAKKELEKRLKILREEEIERLLANLKVRCERMLAMQTEVLTGPRGTEVTWRAIQSNASKQPNGDNVQASLAQGEKEKEIIAEATKAIEVLEQEGSAVAFHSAFVTVREDMRQVHRRLSPEAGRQIDVGPLTQDMERDIIAQLKEMIEVLDKKKDEMDKKKKDDKKKPPSPPSDDKSPPPDQKLLDTIQELKMIRSMQLRLNKRTEDIARSLPKGEEQQQPSDPNLRREIEELRERQERLADITNKIQKGDNK